MTYFAADIHLGGCATEALNREREERFVAWLDSVADSAEHIYLVGDIFDFWFEYRFVVPKGCVRTLGKLAELTDKGVKITMLTGNHDMWLTSYLTTECGVEICTTDIIRTIEGKRYYIAHGDTLGLQDRPLVRFMNFMFRSSVARWLLRWFIHPDLTLLVGKAWSGSSRKAHKAEWEKATETEKLKEKILAPLINFAKNYKDRSIDYFIFGHLHIPKMEDNILFLGDWKSGNNYIVVDNKPQLICNNI